MTFVWWLIIGGVAGWLAGLIMQGRGFGVIGNIIVGIVGGILGGLIFQALNIGGGPFITSLVGAIVLLFIASLFKRPTTV